MRASNFLIDTLKTEEGFSATAYPDSTGFSIGYGTFIDKPEEQYLLEESITKEKAHALLVLDVADRIKFIEQRIKIPLNQNQIDALVLLLYNAGPYAITGGSLDEKINAENWEAVKETWAAYNKSRNRQTGVLEVNPVLVERRKREIDLFFKDFNKPSGTAKGISAAGVILLIGVLFLIFK